MAEAVGLSWRLWWWRKTHRLVHRENWVFVLGPDIWDSDYGVTFKWGLMTPRPGDEWKRWRHDWRISVRWPIAFRSR